MEKFTELLKLLWDAFNPILIVAMIGILFYMIMKASEKDKDKGKDKDKRT